MDAIAPVKATAALRELPGWLRRPRLTAPLGIRNADAWRQLAPLIVLELVVMLLVILPLIELWKHAFGLPDASTFNQISAGWLLPLTMIAAPFGEEIVFRGWLTGRARALWLLGCALTFGALLYASERGANPLAVGGVFLILVIAAPLGWFQLRKRGAPRWFEKLFPAIFYLVVLAFALTHLTNYPGISLLLVPLVLPQAWIGLLLGYTRMRLGLVHAMAMHMASNGAMLLIGVILG